MGELPMVNYQQGVLSIEKRIGAFLLTKILLPKYLPSNKM
jgi:hypothetical protein